MIRSLSVSLDDPRIQAALADLQRRILSGYPDATFTVQLGDEPLGAYLFAHVDVEETMDVLDSIMDRMLEIQVDEYLPVYVIPLQSTQQANNGRSDGRATVPAEAVHSGGNRPWT